MSRGTIDGPESDDYPDNEIETPVAEPVIDESPGANPQTSMFGVYVEEIKVPLPKEADKTARGDRAARTAIVW
jgi:hypothetical protein